MSDTTAFPCDTLIIGQGLAGSALAWRLHLRGQNVRLVDRHDPSSSSRIAAGLLTPITGQRLAHYPAWEHLFPEAVAFYREIERLTATKFFYEGPMVRFFASEDERSLFLEKHADAEDVALCESDDFPESVNAPWGGFEMKQAARLITDAYLTATRHYFESRDSYHNAELTFPDDLVIQPNGITVPRLNLTGQRVVFCQGFEATGNPWFREVPFDAARGEILTLHASDWTEDRIVHAGLWIAPEADNSVRVGASYDRDNLNQLPTDSGRQELLRKLEDVFPPSKKWPITSHQAAIRPIIHGRQPRIGLHPRNERLGYFNGLGSRGALLSPHVADAMATLLCDGIPVEKQFDLHQKVDLSS
ncbi:MAG: FAD-binding oxidoreductase [Planctomycetaceae bacterium]|nr:FAD-binding oxidoreductase [Planctomycetaceae bacterium]